jgi:hypothetical protein
MERVRLEMVSTDSPGMDLMLRVLQATRISVRDQF